MSDPLQALLHYVFALVARDGTTGAIPVYVNNGTITGLKIPVLLHTDFDLLDNLPNPTPDQERAIRTLLGIQANMRKRKIGGKRPDVTITIHVDNGVIREPPYPGEFYWKVFTNDAAS